MILKEGALMLKKSPSGSLCPYYYMEGELHPLKYGSYLDQKEKLINMFQAEQEFILKSSGQHNRRIWIDLYETTLDDEIVCALVLHIKAIRHKIFKLCFAGCPPKYKSKIIKQMKLEDMDIVGQIKFFADPEKAKMWLIGETG
jgi:hypothetical protein